ncbi:MAG: hypothetical protein ACK5LC_12870, partial [Coprobacillaceae bacterium]
MKEIIEWCNNNEGFAMIVLSLGTLIVSIIAIIISIRTARMPYKKKLLIDTGSYVGIGISSTGIHITTTNIGNRSIKIIKIGLLINKKYYFNVNTIKDSQITLATGDSTTQYFDENDLNI